MTKQKTRVIYVGDVAIGGDNPVVIQSMTNTETKDIEATLSQIRALETAGCQIVRIAIDDMEDVAAIRKIKSEVDIPLIADIQYDHRLAVESINNGIDGLRINPGYLGGEKRLREVVDACKENNISIRIGVNAGSLNQRILREYGGVNADSMVYSALEQIELLESMDFYNIKVSLKASSVPLTVETYRKMAKLRDYPLHLGITEAGPVWRGTIKSSVGLGILLYEGIGDTIRVSLTGDPVEEVKVCREILKSLGFLKEGLELISCPTCGRTKVDLLKIVDEAEKRLEGIDKHITVAIMGCPVNGPGEAREADVGIAAGKGEGLIFRKGEIIKKVPEDKLLDELIKEIENL